MIIVASNYLIVNTVSTPFIFIRGEGSFLCAGALWVKVLKSFSKSTFFRVSLYVFFFCFFQIFFCIMIVYLSPD